MNNVGVKVLLTAVLVGLMVYSTYTVIRIAQSRGDEESERGTTFAASPAGELKDVALVDTTGAKFDFEQMEGQPWIGSMFFSTCPHQCAMLNARIKQLSDDRELQGVEFISVSVDPETDTPPVLAEYAKGIEANAERWKFLTGSMPDVARFGTKILRVPTGKKVHTDRLILVDGEGNIRGAFKYNDEDDIAKLRLAASKLGGWEAPEEETESAPADPSNNSPKVESE